MNIRLASSSFAAILIALAVIVDAAAQARIDGKWDVRAESPHGTLTLELDLTQNGAAVTGTLLNFANRKQPVAGEFTKGTLSLATTSGDEIAMSATLQPDGTLTGQLSTARGDVNWTGVRARDVR